MICALCVMCGEQINNKGCAQTCPHNNTYKRIGAELAAHTSAAGWRFNINRQVAYADKLSITFTGSMEPLEYLSA